jgi:hypothetical protein
VFQSAGELDRALVAHLKAVKFDQTAPNAMYNAGVVFALKGDKHQAFEWLGKAKASGRVDVTQIGIDPDAETLRDDPRYKQLFPTPAEFEDPFVEDVEIIQEWRGEALGDEFGWIARNIGDVDGDDVNDVTTSAPSASANGGDRSGKVYVFSGRTGKMLWKRAGEPGNRLGLGVEGAGDVDADGTPDVIAGAPGAGKAYIFSGRNGVTLLTLDAEDPGDLFGRKVSDLGDVNRDGHDDVIVGAPGNDGAGDGAGRAYVYSGRDGSILLALDGASSPSTVRRRATPSAALQPGTWRTAAPLSWSAHRTLGRGTKDAPTSTPSSAPHRLSSSTPTRPERTSAGCSSPWWAM